MIGESSSESEEEEEEEEEDVRSNGEHAQWGMYHSMPCREALENLATYGILQLLNLNFRACTTFIHEKVHICMNIAHAQWAHGIRFG